MTSTRHKWGEKIPLGNHKSEKTCERCGVTCGSFHQWDGPREIHWKEFWRDGDRIDDGSGKTPPCDARLEGVKNGNDGDAASDGQRL